MPPPLIGYLVSNERMAAAAAAADSSLSLSFIGPDHPEESARTQTTVVCLYTSVSVFQRLLKGSADICGLVEKRLSKGQPSLQ